MGEEGGGKWEWRESVGEREKEESGKVVREGGKWEGSGRRRKVGR